MKKARHDHRKHTSLLRRYRALPEMLRSKRAADRREAGRLLVIALCALAMVLSLFYMLDWELSRRAIERNNARFSALYRPEATAQAPATQPSGSSPNPTSEAADPSAAQHSNASGSSGNSTTEAVSPSTAQHSSASGSSGNSTTEAADPSAPRSSPTAEASNASGFPDAPTAKPAVSPVAPTAQPSNAADAPTKSASAELSAGTFSVNPPTEAVPTPSPAPTFTLTPTAEPFEIVLDATRAPLATPDADTRVFALQTPPPAQPSFADLLATNPDTVGFLRIGDALSLPVVQRKNDNETYLNHSFNLEESIAGTLFLDGSNLLVPEDDCLIVYGHNMRNGTMFHQLLKYAELPFLKENALVRFDTIYENRVYAPFAVLTVTAEPDSARYLNLRQFNLNGDAFEDFTTQLRRLSMWHVPMEVTPGDRLLLLVTCEYTHNNGRFVVALRQLRTGEQEDDVRALIQSAKSK